MADLKHTRVAVYVIELFALMPVGFLWITLVHVLGGVFPLGSVTWFVILIAWMLSPVRGKFHRWLESKLY